MDEDLNELNTLTYGQTSYYDYGGYAVSDGDGNVYLMSTSSWLEPVPVGPVLSAVVFKFNDSLAYQTGKWWGGTSYDYMQYYRPSGG